eukprot:scaffold21464_cov49-Cyclotella_meneghiniana.AAC.3
MDTFIFADGLYTKPSTMSKNSFVDTTQLAQLRHDMNSLRAELRGEFQSRVDQLENECSDLKQECQILHQTNSQLKQRCDELHYTNHAMLDKISRLEGEVKLLQTSFDKANRKAKYQEMLLKNLKWEYPLPVPTISRLLSLGYNEAESSEIFQDIVDLEDVTTDMRMGQIIRIVDPNPNARSGHTYDYEGYFPHYEEFADALIEYRHTIDYMENEVFHFIIGDYEIPRKYLDLLQDALQQTHFHVLKFFSNNLDGVGYIDFIVSSVQADKKLKVLSLNNVVFENSSEFNTMCSAINDHASLKEVELTGCRDDEDEWGIFEGIIAMKSATLEKIHLSEITLPDLEPTCMLEFLSSNPSLKEFMIEGDPFDPFFSEDEIVYIADALRNNNTLRRLQLKSHREPPNNIHILESVVFNRSSLNAAFHSNHHCNLTLSGYGNYGETSDIHKFNTCNDPVMNRRKKIYNILSTRNRNRENAAYFESYSISIKHMPQILALLKPFAEHYLHDENGRQEDDEVKPLSIAFEILRDWKMPELYDMDKMDED